MIVGGKEGIEGEKERRKEGIAGIRREGRKKEGGEGKNNLMFYKRKEGRKENK